MNVTLRALNAKPFQVAAPCLCPVGFCVSFITSSLSELRFVLQCLVYKAHLLRVKERLPWLSASESRDYILVQVTLKDEWLESFSPEHFRVFQEAIDWLAAEIIHRRRSWLSNAEQIPPSWYGRAGRARRRRRYLSRTYPLPIAAALTSSTPATR